MFGLTAVIGFSLSMGDDSSMSKFSRTLTAYQWSREAGVPLKIDGPDNEWLFITLFLSRSLSHEDARLLIDVLKKTPVEDEDRGLLLYFLSRNAEQADSRPFFQEAARSGVDGDWQFAAAHMYGFKDEHAVQWWKQTLIDPRASLRLKNGAVIYLTEHDPVKHSDLILGNRLTRQLVAGSGSGSMDSDGDGDADKVDPWPNAAGSAQSEEQKIMTAGFEMLCRQSDGSDIEPSELVLPPKMKAFEMPGRKAQTYWRSSRKECKSESALLWKGAKVNRATGTAEYVFQMVNEPTITFSGTARLVGGEWIAEGTWSMEGPSGTWAVGQTWRGRMHRGG